MRVHWKIRFLGGAGRVMKKQYIQGELSYKEERGGTWAICRFKRVVDKEGVVCSRGGGGDTPMHIMIKVPFNSAENFDISSSMNVQKSDCSNDLEFFILLRLFFL